MRPRTPHRIGKVERSHPIDGQEFYQLLDRNGVSDDIHLFNKKLREWERLIAKARAGVSPASWNLQGKRAGGD